MNKSEGKYYSLEDFFENNKLIKKEEINTIKNFKNIYNILRSYEIIPVRYDDIITNSDIRYEFLMDSIRIACEEQKIDSNTRDIIFQMYEDIYKYLYDDSELDEIEIPEDVIKNIFNKLIIPNHNELDFVMRLIRENKRIFDEEINGKYFSQTIEEGLHTGITKELKIEEENLSHLLGLTNEGSLYEFYRKTVLNNKIKIMLDSLSVRGMDDPGFSYDEFNLMFKGMFGLDYNDENYFKIINWRYDAKDDYLEKRGIRVTDEERRILDEIYSYAPKSQTINFYCNMDNVNLFIKENDDIRKFIFDYVRNDIINKSKLKGNYNIFKNFFGECDLKLLLDIDIDNSSEEVINLINKYIYESKYKLEEDKNFKVNFMKKFGYSYPLVNYYELLSKNVSFYNFSLFKNLNSIIVDYDGSGKKIESDVFLVSYSQDKRTDNDSNVMKLINEKNELYAKNIEEGIYDSSLDMNYVRDLISLFSFPDRDRYYLRNAILFKTERMQDDLIVKENSPRTYSMTLIGFKTGKEEKERLEFQNRKRFKHFLNCETNIASNYYDYVTDYIRNGIEYPLDILEERSRMPYNRKTKVLKIVKPLVKLDKYMMLIEGCKYRVIAGDFSALENMKEMKKKVLYIIDVYQRMAEIKMYIMSNRLENRNINREMLYNYRENLEKESILLEKRNNKFNQYIEYIDDTIIYCENLTKYSK